MAIAIEELRESLLAQVEAAESTAALEEVRVQALGRKGIITEQMKTLGSLLPEERRIAGQAFNALKDEVAAALETRKAALEAAELEARLAKERVDVTLPVRPQPKGRVHPLMQAWDELVAIFGEMGFSVAEGPDIEDDWHNFTALNIPEEH